MKRPVTQDEVIAAREASKARKRGYQCLSSHCKGLSGENSFLLSDQNLELEGDLALLFGPGHLQNDTTKGPPLGR